MPICNCILVKHLRSNVVDEIIQTENSYIITLQAVIKVSFGHVRTIFTEKTEC